MKSWLIFFAVLFFGLALFMVSSPETKEKTENAKIEFSELVGSQVPDFTLGSLDGEVVSMSGLRGKNVVLFFNEGIMCYPACWNQIAAFGSDPYFNSDDVVSLNIVPDTRDKWVEAVGQMPELGKSTILLDDDLEVTKSFNFLNLTSSMHKGKLAGHTYVVVDKEGIIRYVYDDENMAVRNDQIKAELQKL